MSTSLMPLWIWFIFYKLCIVPVVLFCICCTFLYSLHFSIIYHVACVEHWRKIQAFVKWRSRVLPISFSGWTKIVFFVRYRKTCFPCSICVDFVEQKCNCFRFAHSVEAIWGFEDGRLGGSVWEAFGRLLGRLLGGFREAPGWMKYQNCVWALCT